MLHWNSHRIADNPAIPWITLELTSMLDVTDLALVCDIERAWYFPET